jgi:hypothetical protein
MKTTLRDRLAEYNFSLTDQGATIEAHWSLIKSEPISATHKDCVVMDDGRIVLPNDAATEENSALWGNFGAALTYVSEDGKLEFQSTFKLTPNGTKTGAPAFYNGTLRKGAETLAVENRTSEWLKNTLFGKGGWVSQKGRKTGSVPKSKKEAHSLAEKWGAELQSHLSEIQRILESYGDTGLNIPDLSRVGRICKVSAYRHSMNLYREYDAQQRADQAERDTKSLAKKAEKSGLSAETSTEDALKLLRASGLDMAALFAAMQQAQQQA